MADSHTEALRHIRTALIELAAVSLFYGRYHSSYHINHTWDVYIDAYLTQEYILYYGYSRRIC